MSDLDYQTTGDQPTGDQPTAQPQYTLHPVRGIVWATFWGSPLAASIVMAINYKRLGKGTAARNAIVIGVLATVAMFSLIFLLPEKMLDQVPDIVFVAPQLILAYKIADYFQSEFIEHHASQEGTVASAWPSVGIGMLCLPLVLAGLLGFAFLLEPSLGTLVTFGDDEVYYTGEATEQDARRLADALRETDFFGFGGITVQLESSAGQDTVSFIMDGEWNDVETVVMFDDLGQSLIEWGFSKPLTIRLCDEYLETQNSITVE